MVLIWVVIQNELALTDLKKKLHSARVVSIDNIESYGTPCNHAESTKHYSEPWQVCPQLHPPTTATAFVVKYIFSVNQYQ